MPRCRSGSPWAGRSLGRPQTAAQASASARSSVPSKAPRPTTAPTAPAPRTARRSASDAIPPAANVGTARPCDPPDQLDVGTRQPADPRHGRDEEPGAPAAASHPSVVIRSRSTGSPPRDLTRPSRDLEPHEHASPARASIVPRPSASSASAADPSDHPRGARVQVRARMGPRPDPAARLDRRAAVERASRSTSRFAGSPPKARSMSTTCSHVAPAARRAARPPRRDRRRRRRRDRGLRGPHAEPPTGDVDARAGARRRIRERYRRGPGGSDGSGVALDARRARHRAGRGARRRAANPRRP